MSKESTWLNKIHDGCRDVNRVASNLQHLANAFYRLGNEKVAGELYDYVDVLEKGAKMIHVGVGQELREGMEQAQKMSGALLQASLYKGENPDE